MTKKIMIADDSTTIQKVIKITLSNEPYELVEVLSEKSLWEVLGSDQFDLVLLDYNLSDKKNGNELIRELRTKAPGVAILAMLGTFDNVDEKGLMEAGADDKIVKPFESTKFIEKCRTLVEAPREVGILPDPVEADEFVEITRPKDAVVYNWSGEVPDIIGKNSDAPIVPPVINGNRGEEISFELEQNIEVEKDDFDLDATSTFNLSELTEAGRQATPSNEDLEYPDITKYSRPTKNEERDIDEILLEVENVKDKTPPKSKLISLDELAPEDNAPDDDATDPNYKLSPEIHSALEDEIAKDSSPDELWAVDEIQKGEAEAIKQEKSMEDEMPVIDMAAMREELVPLIEDLVKKYCQTAVEKVAWEVIPDLAENLIKKELKEIAKGISE